VDESVLAMNSATLDLCAALVTIGHEEPIGIFRGVVEPLIELGLVEMHRRGILRLTSRGNEVLAKIEASESEDIDVRDFQHWMFSPVFSPCNC
jgi:hypothetical protein